MISAPKCLHNQPPNLPHLSTREKSENNNKRKGSDAPEQLAREGSCYELSEFKDAHPRQR
jgi:hypothetical protein